MSELVLGNEPMIRLFAFAGIFAVMAGWELVAPRRDQRIGRGTRWPSNIGVVVFDTVLVRLLFPTTAVGLALVAEAQGWGLFHALALPIWGSVPLAVIALDLAIYLQHVLFHAVPALWRLHRMHHADLEFDVTTGARFHPIEILLSMGIKLGVVQRWARGLSRCWPSRCCSTPPPCSTTATCGWRPDQVWRSRASAIARCRHCSGATIGTSRNSPR